VILSHCLGRYDIGGGWLDWFLRWWNSFTVSERMSGDEVGYDQASRIVETREMYYILF
jgi:hypothetical protein